MAAFSVKANIKFTINITRNVKSDVVVSRCACNIKGRSTVTVDKLTTANTVAMVHTLQVKTISKHKYIESLKLIIRTVSNFSMIAGYRRDAEFYGGPGGHASFQFGSSYLRASSCQFLSSHLRHSSSALVVMPVAVLRHASSCLRTSVTPVAVFESPSFQYFSVLTPVTYPRQSSRQLLSSIIPVRGCPT